MKCGVAWRVQCEVWSVKCEVWSVKCEVWSVQWEACSEVWSVDWEECSVKCGVWSVQCGVWRVQWEVWRAKWSFKCDMWNRTPLSQSARTHGLGWCTAHASLIDEKGLIYIYIFKATFRPASCGYYWYKIVDFEAFLGPVRVRAPGRHPKTVVPVVIFNPKPKFWQQGYDDYDVLLEVLGILRKCYVSSLLDLTSFPPTRARVSGKRLADSLHSDHSLQRVVFR